MAMQEWERLLVASLFHDIGKFWQRTGEPVPPRYAEFDAKTYGRHGKHACWSAAFLEQWLPDWQEAAWSVLTHHQPQDWITKLVAVADHLSASEREDEEQSEPSAQYRGGGQVWSAQQPGQQQLHSIFGYVHLDDEHASSPTYVRLHPLQVSRDVLFPHPQPLSRRDERQCYRELWQDFINDVRQLPATLSFDARFTTLLALLHKYTWCIPSAYYQTVPDISLYDHSRITCALAAALFRSAVDEATLDALWTRQSDIMATARIALLAGDITGIQRFLYTITSTGAARSLRGRSFALQLVTETVARWILRQLALPITNLLYAGGGRFYLITPALSDQQLTDLRRTLDRLLLATYDGDLYVALAHHPIPFNQFTRAGALKDVWAALHAALSQEKYRKFSALEPAEQFTSLFTPYGAGGPEPLCSSCRREAIGAITLEDGTVLCSRCASFRDLGEQLCQARWLFLREVEPALPASELERARYTGLLNGLGFAVQFLADEQALRRFVSQGPGTLFRLDATDFLTGPALDVAEASGTIGLSFALIANVVPRDAYGKVIDFEHIAETAQGAKALSVLRMDVDNLGAIFSQGLKDRATLSRLASLSTSLRLFFEGWLAALAHQQNREQPRVYIVYSGGDDLFLVGAWDMMPDVAVMIQQDFQDYTGHNPELHLSGGLALVPVEHPLYRAADDAKAALEAAKRRHENGRVVKNAVTFLGQTVSWPTFERARDRVELLVALVEQRGVPRSLIQTLRTIAQSYREAQEAARRTGHLQPGQRVYGRWMWQAAYALSRIAERVADPTSKRQLEEIRVALLNVAESEAIETLAMVSRWAELRTRKGE